jgi:ArsR family transcriptional regulator
MPSKSCGFITGLMQKTAYTNNMNINDHTIIQQACLFKTLMHPARIAILESLRNSEECVCHLEAHLHLRQAYLSQQLAVLRKAGLIADRRDGMNMFYRITQPEVLNLLDAACTMVGGTPRIRLESAIPHACPCPKCADVTAAGRSHDSVDRSK